MLKIIRPPLLFVILFAFGGLWFQMSAPRECPPVPADADIFVLTGDVRRIPFAAEMLNGHPARHLFIIGAGTHNFSSDISPDARSRIKSEFESRTTAENAEAIRVIARKGGMRRFVLVTTSDHMNRAMLLVRRQLPGADIIACPVPLSGMLSHRRLERWAKEYVKYIGTIAGAERKRNNG